MYSPPIEIQFRPQTKPLFAMIMNDYPNNRPIPYEILFPDFQTIHNKVWTYAMIISFMNHYPNIHIFTVINDDFRSYLISCFGEAWTLKMNHFLKKSPKDNYVRFSISYNNNVCIKIRAQRAVAHAFIADSELAQSIDHIDSNPLNNDLRNLFPTNQSVNALKAFRNPNKKSKNGFPVEETDSAGNVKMYFNMKMCYEHHPDMVHMKGIPTGNFVSGKRAGLATFQTYLRLNETVVIRDSSNRTFQLKRIEAEEDDEEAESDEEAELYIQGEPRIEEIWKPVIDFIVRSDNSLFRYSYPDYEISNLGNVRSSKLNKIEILTPQFTSGYYKIHLLNAEHGSTEFLVSRLVLFLHGSQNFITEMGEIIHYYDLVADHISGDVKDNSINNLQWVTGSINCELVHIRKGERNNCIGAFDLQGNLLCVFASSYVLKHLLKERNSTTFEKLCQFNTENPNQPKSYFNVIFKYIPRQFYYQNRDSNQDLYIFKPHDSNYKITVEKYETLTDGINFFPGRVLETLYKQEDIEKNIGDVMKYSRRKRRQYMNTPLTYQDVPLNGFIWRIIYGFILMYTKTNMNMRNADFEWRFADIDRVIAQSTSTSSTNSTS